MLGCVYFVIVSLGWRLVARAALSEQSLPVPAITSFTTPAQGVNRNALVQRTARIPVSWTTVNRPFFANLIFEAARRRAD